MVNSLSGMIGREYLRVSARGERSITEQHDDNSRASASEGVTLGVPYSDQGSASPYAKHARGDFDRLIADLRSDQFKAQILWLWESSRGSRRVGEWATLLDLCEDYGVLIHVTSHERTYDPSNYRDRETLLTDGVSSEIEVRRLSARTRRGIDANIRDGKPHGICPLGFEREYEIKRGKRVPVRQYAHPVEGPWIIELFERVRAHDSFCEIERDWAARVIVGRRGKPLSAQTLRDLVTHVCYLGLRCTKGGTVQAAWPRLVSDALFYEVQQIISDPSRIKGNPGGAHYALTGAITCDRCTGPITVRYRSKEINYECKRGCWRVSKADVDEILVGDAERPGVILSYLARPDVYRALDAGDPTGETAEIRDGLAKARADLQETEQAHPETLSEERRFARRGERLEARIAELEQRQRKLVRPTSLSALFHPGPDVAGRWRRTPLAGQRAIAALLLSPDVMGQPRIRPVAAVVKTATMSERIRWVRA
ncbi:recombinase family protein [Streptomyces sp. NPDC058268]|uniref:recombinase family protein n=1 Tax=Streptomyces sp. NPDC058268 TaxID=3346413 RepID=UPI0036EAA085